MAAAPSRTRAARNRSAVAVRRQAAILRAQAREAAQRAQRQLIILAPLLIALALLYRYRVELFGVDKPVRLATSAGLVVIGWAFARSLGRAIQPHVDHGLDPGAAAVAGFLVRLLTLLVILAVSLRIAGLKPGTLVLGASFTAVVVGLAAQQTVGNLLAGIVLLSAHPFRVGERVRFNGFGMDVEGTVAAHGLLYLTLTDGADLVMVPNNTALTMSVRPLREPAAVDMRARLPLGVDPVAVEEAVDRGVSVPTKGPPHVALEEFDGNEIVVRVKAVPVDSRRGGELAREVLEAIAALDEEVDKRSVNGGPRRTSEATY